MLVGALMNSNVVTVSPETGLPHAVQLLTHYHVGVLPVTSGGTLCGIVTDRDILTRSVARDTPLSDLTVRDVMTRNVTTVSPDADVREAASIMSDRRIRRLPVTRGRQLVGILSLADLARARSCDMEACLALSRISSPMEKPAHQIF